MSDRVYLLEGQIDMKVFGYVVLAAVVAGVLVNLPDIKRYIKISMM